MLLLKRLYLKMTPSTTPTNNDLIRRWSADNIVLILIINHQNRCQMFLFHPLLNWENSKEDSPHDEYSNPEAHHPTHNNLKTKNKIDSSIICLTLKSTASCQASTTQSSILSTIVLLSSLLPSRASVRSLEIIVLN